MNVMPSAPLGPSTSQLATAYRTIRTSVLADAASKLGISLDQLRAELDAGKPLADIATLAGITLSSASGESPPAATSDASRGTQVDLLL